MQYFFVVRVWGLDLRSSLHPPLNPQRGTPSQLGVRAYPRTR